jgi:hypothetical protein
MRRGAQAPRQPIEAQRTGLVNRPKIGDLGRSARLPANSDRRRNQPHSTDARRVFANLKTIVETSFLQTVIAHCINFRSY